MYDESVGNSDPDFSESERGNERGPFLVQLRGIHILRSASTNLVASLKLMPLYVIGIVF